MADIAKLGFSVDTSGLVRAERDLDKLGTAGKKAERDVGRLGDSSKEAGGKITTAAEEGKKAFDGLGKAVGAVIGILATANAAQGINEIIQYNAEINLLTQSLGVSRDALQVWGNIGKSAGVDIADIFKDVNEKIAEFASTGGGEAVDVFKRLKLDVKDVIALSPDQQVLKITKAMSEMKDMSRGEKIFLLESLGNDLSKILPMLDDNAAKLREIDRLTRSSGAIITAEQNANLTEAKGNLDKLALSMKGAGNAAADVGAQIVNAIAGDAMDAVSDLDDAIYRQAENAQIMGASFVEAYRIMSEHGTDHTDTMTASFGDLTEYVRIGWSYWPVWSAAAYVAIDEQGRAWNESAQAQFNSLRAHIRSTFADMIETAGKAYDLMANFAITGGNNLFGGTAAPSTGTFAPYVAELREAATYYDDASKKLAHLSEQSGYAAERAINSAAAYQVESEQRRTLNIEMGIAERQFAALGSGLESAGKSGQQFYVNQEKVNEALKDGGGKANDAKKQVDGLIDSLTKQRIELENGKLAAEYYTNRLNGLTDAEARAAAGAGQYNAYLAERKRQQQALAGIDGGLKSGYLAKLDGLGLMQTGSVFDAIRVKTEAAIATNQRFESSLKSIGTTATAIGGTASQVVGILQKLGWTKNQSIGIAANLKQESEFRPSAVGDGGKAYGVAQWHPDRQANFQRVMGKSIVGSSLEEQLKFLTYEMRRGNEIAAGRKLEATTTPQAAAAVVSRYYERPKDTEVEMQRRAEIATRIAAATGETASFTEKTTTALRGNTAASTDLLNVTSAYSGQFDNARVTAGDIAGLINTELQIATNGLLKTASDHTAEVTKTGYEYRQIQLAQMQLEPQMQAMVLAGESQAAYAEQYNALLRERAAIQDPSAIGDYKRGLSDQTLDKTQIESLTGLKLQNTFDAMSAATARQRQEALMSVDAWRLQQLTLETGLTPAMAQYQLQFEQQATHAQKWREITDDAINGVADGLTNAAMGMETDWSGVINKMIAETIKLNTIQPLLKSFFGIFGIATPFADGGAFGSNGVQAYANGGAFHNSVLTKPTQFFANGGLAVAGEAGAEAVMPLTRIGGRLGVQAVGGTTQITVKNHIEIINKADTKVTTKESSTPDGSMSLQILIEPLESMISDRARRGMGLANTFRTVG